MASNAAESVGDANKCVMDTVRQGSSRQTGSVRRNSEMANRVHTSAASNDGAEDSMERTSGEGTSLKLMSLNDNKAGMEGLDKEKINAIIESASKGSKFYAKQAQDQAKLNLQIENLLGKLQRLTDVELEEARKEANKLIISLNRNRDLSRTIVHVDMDQFYAAVEMRDNPKLKDIPMAVGGMGMLSTSNYAARKFGVRAAMPGFIGKKLCPGLVLVPPDMEKYAAEAKKIREVFAKYDPNYVPMSLDEAYLDITEKLEDEQLNPTDGDEPRSASEIVATMREEIRHPLCHTKQYILWPTVTGGPTASAGIAPNSMLAKIASDMNKPNGQFELKADAHEILNFMKQLPIRKASGLGKVQEQMLNSIGVKTCYDLFLKRAEIKLLFSDLSFHHYMQISQGIGSTRLEPPDERVRKSISTETTFKDTADRKQLLDICADLCRDLSGDMKKRSILGLSVTVKIKSHDFKIKTKVSQLREFTNESETIFAVARKILCYLLDTAAERPLALRLMGVRMSELRETAQVGVKQKSIMSFVSNKHHSDAGKPEEVSINTSVPEYKGDSKASSNTRVPSVEMPPSRPGSSKSQICPEKDGGVYCPVCDSRCRNLAELNSHLDRYCLSPNETDEVKSKKDEGKFHTSFTTASKPTKAKPSTNPGPSSSGICAPKTFGNPSDQERGGFACPVCESGAVFQTNDQLNRHLDECLNQAVLSDCRASHDQQVRNDGILSKKRSRETELHQGTSSKKFRVKDIQSYFRADK